MEEWLRIGWRGTGERAGQGTGKRMDSAATEILGPRRNTKKKFPKRKRAKEKNQERKRKYKWKFIIPACQRPIRPRGERRGEEEHS